MVLTHLGHLAATGHEVTIRANVVDTRFTIAPAIRIEKIRLPSPCGTLISAIFAKFSADHVIATIIPTAFCLYLRNRKKVVYLAQEYEELGYRSHPARFLIRIISRIGLTLFGISTLAVSAQLGQFLRAQFRANVEIVPNGVDTEVFYPDPDPELLSLKRNNRAVLLFARKDSRKGFDVALDVVRKLMKEVRFPLDVWIFGDYAGMELSGLPCRLFGFLDDVRLRKVLSSADVFLYPSRTDGFGLIVAEAFACKCPVVTTTAVPHAEDGVNALVSTNASVDDLAAKVSRLLTDEQLCFRLAGRGYDVVREMPVRAAARRFAALLTESGAK
jgi:glycosyltransferase involved in cell wall biosynthesis